MMSAIAVSWSHAHQSVGAMAEVLPSPRGHLEGKSYWSVVTFGAALAWPSSLVLTGVMVSLSAARSRLWLSTAMAKAKDTLKGVSPCGAGAGRGRSFPRVMQQPAWEPGVQPRV